MLKSLILAAAVTDPSDPAPSSSPVIRFRHWLKNIEGMFYLTLVGVALMALGYLTRGTGCRLTSTDAMPGVVRHARAPAAFCECRKAILAC